MEYRTQTHVSYSKTGESLTRLRCVMPCSPMAVDFELEVKSLVIDIFKKHVDGVEMEGLYPRKLLDELWYYR